MPYKKPAYKRGSKTQKKRFNKGSSKRGPSNKSLAKKIKHIENDLVEQKWSDQFMNAATIDHVGSGLFHDYLQIVQGTTASTRVGQKICPTSLQFKAMIRSDIDQVQPERIRMIAFWDRQCNGSAPALSGDNGLLDATTIVDLTLCPRNYDTLQRFTIVLDKVFLINPVNPYVTILAGANTTTDQTMEVGKMIVKNFRLGRTIKYDGNVGTLADLVSNAFYVLLITNNTDANTQPTIDGGIRMYYKDT